MTCVLAPDVAESVEPSIALSVGGVVGAGDRDDDLACRRRVDVRCVGRRVPERVGRRRALGERLELAVGVVVRLAGDDRHGALRRVGRGVDRHDVQRVEVGVGVVCEYVDVDRRAILTRSADVVDDGRCVVDMRDRDRPRGGVRQVVAGGAVVGHEADDARAARRRELSLVGHGAQRGLVRKQGRGAVQRERAGQRVEDRGDPGLGRHVQRVVAHHVTGRDRDGGARQRRAVGIRDGERRGDRGRGSGAGAVGQRAALDPRQHRRHVDADDRDRDRHRVRVDVAVVCLVLERVGRALARGQARRTGRSGHRSPTCGRG